MSMPIAPDCIVTVDYVLRDDQGEQIDASPEGTPLEYVHGRGQLVPMVEQALAGKTSGDSVSVTVPPDEAYGERDPERLVRTERGQFDFAPEAGMVVHAQLPDGQRCPFVIAEVDDEHVVLDGNHPLAGMTLAFEMQVVSVREATAEELAELE